jgi:hypothetical protein
VSAVNTNRTIFAIFLGFLAVVLNYETLRAGELVFLLWHDDNVLLLISYFRDREGIGMIVSIYV